MALSQNELNRAVAKATGESVSTIQRLGFLLADPDDPVDDLDTGLLSAEIIDWDALALRRYASTGEPQLAVA